MTRALILTLFTLIFTQTVYADIDYQDPSVSVPGTSIGPTQEQVNAGAYQSTDVIVQHNVPEGYLPMNSVYRDGVCVGIEIYTPFGQMNTDCQGNVTYDGRVF